MYLIILAHVAYVRDTVVDVWLKTIQQNLGLPLHSLKQDKPTQWNSTLHMLQSILEQKMATAAYATE